MTNTQLPPPPAPVDIPKEAIQEAVDNSNRLAREKELDDAYDDGKSAGIYKGATLGILGASIVAILVFLVIPYIVDRHQRLDDLEDDMGNAEVIDEVVLERLEQLELNQAHCSPTEEYMTLPDGQGRCFNGATGQIMPTLDEPHKGGPEVCMPHELWSEYDGCFDPNNPVPNTTVPPLTDSYGCWPDEVWNEFLQECEYAYDNTPPPLSEEQLDQQFIQDCENEGGVITDFGNSLMCEYPEFGASEQEFMDECIANGGVYSEDEFGQLCDMGVDQGGMPLEPTLGA